MESVAHVVSTVRSLPPWLCIYPFRARIRFTRRPSRGQMTEVRETVSDDMRHIRRAAASKDDWILSPSYSGAGHGLCS